MIGIACWQSGEFDCSAAQMRSAIALSSRPPRRRRYGTAIRLEPANPGPYNTLAQVLRQTGNIEESKKMFAEGARVKKNTENKLGTMSHRE